MKRNLLYPLGLLAWAISAQANPCSCPANDPLAKDGNCGLRPIAMLREAKPFSNETCSPKKEWLSETLRPYRESLSSAVTPKSNAELLDYMSCYQPDHDLFCHYKNSLAPYLHYAAKVSNLPFAVESCLLLKENSFWSGRNSRVGALGYAQLMPNTITDLNTCLSKSAQEWKDFIKTKNDDLKALEQKKAAKKISGSEYQKTKSFLKPISSPRGLDRECERSGMLIGREHRMCQDRLLKKWRLVIVMPPFFRC